MPQAMIIPRLATICVWAFVLGITGAKADLIKRGDIFGNPERANALISPDAKALAFLAPVNGVMNVWVGPATDIKGAKPVTKETVRPIRSFSWGLTGRHILYQQDKGGDEDYHIYSVDLAQGSITNLTNHKDTRAEIIATSYQKPDTILAGLNNRDPKWHDVWAINIATGKAQRIEKNDGFASFLADRDLTLRVALKATAAGGFDVYKRDGQSWTKFFAIPADDALTSNPFAISADGRSLLMLDSRGRDKAALVAIDLTTGGQTLLGQNANADVTSTIQDPLTNAVLAYGAEYDRPIWTAIDKALTADLAFLKSTVPGVWSLMSQSQDNMVWTVRIDNIVEPVKFARYDRRSRTLSPLFVARPKLIGAALSPMTPQIIAARDGLKLVSYLTLPKGSDKDGNGRPDRPLPMVLNVHGGPWARDSLGYDPEHQWLANRGYAVLAVNFRGSTGLGKSFINAADRQWAGAMHDDLIDAVNWATKEGIAIKDKIAIYGGSYGGYAALVGVTFTPKTFACGVSIVGPSNLNTLLASIPPYWASFLDTFKRRVGDPTAKEGQALLTERSPLFRAGAIERPLLIAQGANDPRVKQAESDQIVSAMTAKRIPVTYVLYADEGHGFARPENRLSFFAIAESFLAQCLGGRFEPIADDFNASSVAVPTGKEHIPNLGEALARIATP